MPEHTFTLILDRDPDPYADELYEAGCDDALLGSVDGVGYADFTREADDFITAVATAIRDVTSAGLHVHRIEPDDLVTMTDIARRLGRTRESVRLLIAGERGPGGFPPPLSHTRDRNRLWRWNEVAEWTHSHLGASTEPRHAVAVAVLNAALELARHADVLEDLRDAPEPLPGVVKFIAGKADAASVRGASKKATRKRSAPTKS